MEAFIIHHYAAMYTLIPAIAILDSVQVGPQMHLEQIFVGFGGVTVIVIWKGAVVRMQMMNTLEPVFPSQRA